MCIGHGSGRFQRILTYQRQFLDVRQSGFVGKISPALLRYERNFPPEKFFFFLFRPISGGIQPTLFARNDLLFSKKLFYRYKKTSNTINVDSAFCLANFLVAFVSGRLLRFHIPKFHFIQCRE